MSTEFARAQKNDPIVLGYFPSWSESWTSTNANSKLREIPSFVNHIFLSFAKPNLRYTAGSYDISNTGIQTPYDGCTLKESVSALKDKGIKVILSVGGETYWGDPDSYNINYQEIKDLVDDMGFAGIDWDFEPNGSFANIGSALNVQRFKDFFTNSRAIMPKSEGYILACAPSGVGALGGQTNDDPSSPFAFVNRNDLTGETDNNLYSSTAQTNGINLFGFSATGHMIPVFESVGNLIDLVAFQGYNVGGSTNRSIMYDSYAHYADQYSFCL
jgi:chitinase